jgi:hypothetical protein
VNDSFDALLDGGAHDVANARDVGFDQPLGGRGVDRHDRGAVDHRVTSAKSIPN